jgi:hypothetical protein
MDRRRFAKLIAAAVIGVRVADEVLPAGPTLFGQPVTTAAHPTANDFDAATWIPVTNEQLADANMATVDQLVERWRRLLEARHA